MRALVSGLSAIVIVASLSAPANAQSVVLDPITIIATKTVEFVINTLAPVSTVRQEQIQQIQPNRASDIFFGVPGVTFQQRGDDPATAINIRGLQDFGRVAVLIDGARQNFQRTGHNADGQFYIDPALIGGVDVVRGPTSNIYGSGAIGGVVVFRTIDVQDILSPGQNWGVISNFEIGSNTARGATSHFLAARPNANTDIVMGGSFRDHNNYKDGNGLEWPNTAYSIGSGLFKATFRPSDGHEIKFSGLISAFDHINGIRVAPSTAIFDANVVTSIANVRWRYSRPEDRLFDIDFNAYFSQTDASFLKIAGTTNASSGAIGDRRNFKVDTVGFDANNTSRFDTGAFRHAFTYGLDAFNDQVNVVDPNGSADLFTPNGQRTVGGGFTQLKSNYSTWLEIVGALRFDAYNLSGGGAESSGSRLSPKITVGVTPVTGIQPYVSYAEGYRAPAVTEAFVTGTHPVAPAFTFLGNTALRPETGKNQEIGINFKFDNVLRPNDAFRAKANVFRNNVDDFIELTFVPFVGVGPCPAPPFCFQYQNIRKAQIEGVEFESSYDAGTWFAGLSAHHIRGRNEITGAPLLKIPTDQVATTFGVRLLERKLVVSVRWAAVSAKNPADIPDNVAVTGSPDLPPSGSYNLVNLYAGYSPTPNATWSLSVENLLNEQYAPYLQVYPGPGGGGSLPFPSAGITVKGALTVKFNDQVAAIDALGLR